MRLLAYRRAFLGVAAAACVAVVPPLSGQTRKPLTLVGLAELPRLLDPQLSPDGRAVAYTLMRADWRANRPVGHIWMQPAPGEAPTQLTAADGEMSARWSPDSASLLYLARGANGSLQVFLVPASGGGRARELTRHATSVSQPTWSSDGEAIYFIAPDARTAEETDRERLRDDVYAFEENFKQRHLWRVTTATGVEQQITTGALSVLGYRLSRDGRHIVLHRAPTPLVADASDSEIWIADADGGNARQLTRNAIEESEGELSPDATQLLFLAGANDRLEPYYTSTLFLLSPSGGEPRRLLPGFPYAIERAAWGPDSRTVFAVVNMGVHSEVFRIDVQDRRATALTDGRHSVQFWSVSASARRMIFQLDEPTRLGDAWTLPFDAAAAQAPTRVTGIYDGLDRDFHLPRQERVAWAGADGTVVEGVLFYPLAYEPGRRYPLVVQLHGGPQESDKFGYGPGVIVNYVPVLASLGYAVLRPNYRGSAGYGDLFLRDVVGHYFHNQHLDVLAGVDHLVKEGIADPGRLAVMGWSAGGHLTNKLITFTSRFKAASVTAGAANWVSLFAQTDSRSSRTVWFGGTPWERSAPIDLYWDHSPLKHAAAVTTPTLFIVGEEDPRVPMAQSVEMYRALTANGVPAKLYVAPREGHQWGELRHQLFKANVELEWFERHVRGRAYVWERAPAGTP
jgi:dipeptidyl aminopeptidase/acylaminoacyl peptidase